MLKNPSTDPGCKTTLIIAPLALLDQWKAEIDEKTNCGLKCLIYHGEFIRYVQTDLSHRRHAQVPQKLRGGRN